jgi:outer membrane receptor for ferrienterochelin and colicin
MPERSDNLRGELSWRTGDKAEHYTLCLTASGFYNNIRDRIILSEYAPAQYQYANLKRWETTGGGLGVNVMFHDWLRFRSDVVMTGFYNAYSEDQDSLRTLNWSPDWVNELTMSFFKKRATCTIWHKMTGRTPFFFEEDGQVKQGESQGWNLLNAALGGSFFKQSIRLNAGVKNILNTRQIRSGASDVVGHSDGDLRPVHWGRTYFVTAIFSLHSKV